MTIETVYTPVHDAAGWAVEAVAVMYARTAGRETRPILFLNGRHYGDVFATRDDARAYILKEPHARPLTPAQIVEMAHGRRTYADYSKASWEAAQ
ncbi:MAG: hypothetical protein J6Q14_03770 [Oscillospiraceae bacterium]|nr:hypothetical protein [Oscillospiraceae bacterium]MBO5917867.1 hypothetical protein [Oscillospiraceae bacterium]